MEFLDLKSFKEKISDSDMGGEGDNKWQYKGTIPALIDFYADWCGPCRAIAPVLEELAGEFEGKVNIFKIDTEKEQELASMFGIRSIPSLLFIPMKGDPHMITGALSKPDFIKTIDEVLGVK